MSELEIFKLIMSAIVISFVCNGIHLLFSPDKGLLFSFIGEWYEEKIVNKRKAIKRANVSSSPTETDKYGRKYDFIVNPLWGCIYCMSSFWSIVLYPLINGYSWDILHELPITMLFCLALNPLIKRQIS